VWSYNGLAQGAEYSLTESALSPFQAEPTQRQCPEQEHFYIMSQTFVRNDIPTEVIPEVFPPLALSRLR
jgi:hypothetical protein